MQSERESSNYLQDARGSTSQDTDAGDAWFEGSRQPGRSYEAGLMIYWSGAAKTAKNAALITEDKDKWRLEIPSDIVKNE